MTAKLKFVSAMLIFGSIGIFVKNINIPSAEIVQWRTIIGSIFLLLVFVIKKKPIDYTGVKRNWIPLIIAGIVLGGGWAFLFEAFQHTSVGVATMLYYCAPIIVFSLAPVIFKEKVTTQQVIGIAAAVIGMLIVNLVGTRVGEFSSGALYALIAALLYAALMIVNKYIHEVSGLESTFVQLIVAALIMTIYCFATTGKLLYLPAGKDILLISILGILHTGIAFSMYITAMKHLSGQNISLFSYIDPASALIFAFIFLEESLKWYQILGAILIFGGTLFSQMKKYNIKDLGGQDDG
ncbi:DMT family transporter [Anaerovorax sp. IOR16]|uniref:DMT family transporter n=1 Tax=Anaerovorax sp. IOR16 TaxID=2773458 RepID=UPI0019D01FDD|nr:EamA family transporter [Anaerovorax sp. IOR16]